MYSTLNIRTDMHRCVVSLAEDTRVVYYYIAESNATLPLPFLSQSAQRYKWLFAGKSLCRKKNYQPHRASKQIGTVETARIVYAHLSVSPRFEQFFNFPAIRRNCRASDILPFFACFHGRRERSVSISKEPGEIGKNAIPAERALPQDRISSLSRSDFDNAFADANLE